jgi:hypothetical protein
MSKVPVLFTIFNRPDRTQIVFNEIRKYKPDHLFIHADGPRSFVPADYDKCKACRNIIVEQIDWDCEIHTNFREENRGCGRGPSEAMTWFFSQVNEGIIIEDDCVPHPDFFRYCEELLDRYRNDERVMVIGATTYRDDYPCEHSYTFTTYGTMAAWATWKRVWDKYDFHLTFLTRDKLEDKLKKSLFSKFEVTKWMELYDWIKQDGFTDYWDWQLQFMMFYSDGIAIRPKRNMIKNIGTGDDATHTVNHSSEMFVSERAIFSCLPLSHPTVVMVNKKADAIYFRRMFGVTLMERTGLFIKKVIAYIKKIR